MIIILVDAVSEVGWAWVPFWRGVDFVGVSV